MSFRNRVAATVLGLALMTPSAQLAFAEGSVGEGNSDVYSDVYSQSATPQQRVTLWDLLQGRAQPQRQEAHNAAAASATDAAASGSSQASNPHMYDYLSGPAYRLVGGN